MSSGGTKNRLSRATATTEGQRFQSSSHSGRASFIPLATMASGLAAMTASTLTVGATTSSSSGQRTLATAMRKRSAAAIAASSAFSIAGGGDTLAAIAKYGIEGDVGYISTGGGAFLEVLEGKTLPAFEILAKRAAG